MRATSTARLVEWGISALRRLASEPSAAGPAIAAGNEIEAAWRRVPFSVGLAGTDLSARTRCLDALCGGGVIEALGRVPGGAVFRIRRGDVTLFRAIRIDGAVEEHTIPAARPEPSGEPAVSSRAKLDELRAEVASHASQVERAEHSLPGLVRVRPPRWAFWLWPIRWLLAVLVRGKLAAHRREQATLEAARSRLGQLETDVVLIKQPPHETRRAVVERLRALGNGMLVREIQIELEAGPLPHGIELVELASPPYVEEVMLVNGDALYVVGDGSSAPRPIGALDDALAALPAIVAEARALRLGRHARDVIIAGLAALEDRRECAEIEFRNRLARLEMMRVIDQDRFVAEQVDRVRPRVLSGVTTVIEHATAQIGAELAQIAAGWIAAIDTASSVDELKLIAARIDDESALPMQQAWGVVMAGIAGCAHDLYPELIGTLRSEGLPEGRAPTPEPTFSSVEILRALTSKRVNLTGSFVGAGNWLTGLFRSIEARRAEMREKLERHVGHVRELALAELLDAEPRLHRRLADALTSVLSTALGHQMAWLERELAGERDAIADEREALAPMVRLCDELRVDVRRLAELIADRETHQITTVADLARYEARDHRS